MKNVQTPYVSIPQNKDNLNAKLLIAGMGGGLDVMNASALYFHALASGIDVTLGSIKSKSIDYIVDGAPIHESAAWVLPTSTFATEANGVRGRYCEAAIAATLKNPILYFSQRLRGTKQDSEQSLLSLRDAITMARDKYGFTHMLFVDCGGDSLTFKTTDAIMYSETADPFAGNDAKSLFALDGVKGSYLAVAGIGLDVNSNRAKDNLFLLNEQKQHYGTIDLRTGRTKEWKLSFKLVNNSEANNMYGALARRIVKLTPEDFTDKTKFSSLTAPVLYHSLREEYGPQYTAANWAQGAQGTVEVLPSHSKMHIVAADNIHNIKKELNGK